MAKARPEAIYAEVSRSRTSYEPGYRKITYKNLANAINGVAWSLGGRLGRGKVHETLAYIGLNDFGNIFMVLGAVKAWYKVRNALVGLANVEKLYFNEKPTVVSDLPNTVSNHISLFKNTKCKILFTLAEWQ